jgi:hypothetical protein
MPMAAAGLVGEAVMLPFVIIPRRTSEPKQISKKKPKTAKKSAKKAAEKSAKKSSKKKKEEAAKRWKPEMEHKTVGKKKERKKAVKKRRRRSPNAEYPLLRRFLSVSAELHPFCREHVVVAHCPAFGGANARVRAFKPFDRAGRSNSPMTKAVRKRPDAICCSAADTESPQASLNCH